MGRTTKGSRNVIKKMKVRQGGFTLIEMMVVVLIIGILSAVAFPSYVSYVQKSRRFEAQAALYEVAARMERYYTEKNTYADAEEPSDTSHYEISFVSPPAQTYVIQAVPQGKQGEDGCGTLTLAHTGAYTPTTNGCWK